MKAILGIGGFVVMVALVMMLQRLLGRGAAMVSGAVTGNTRKRGLAAVHQQLDFSVPLDGKVVVDRVLTTLGIAEGPADGFRVEGRSADGGSVEICVGNRFSDRLTFLIETHAVGEGCAGFSTVAKWTESSGQIIATDEAERLQAHVRSAINALGGTLVETRST